MLLNESAMSSSWAWRRWAYCNTCSISQQVALSFLRVFLPDESFCDELGLHCQKGILPTDGYLLCLFSIAWTLPSDFRNCDLVGLALVSKSIAHGDARPLSLVSPTSRLLHGPYQLLGPQASLLKYQESRWDLLRASQRTIGLETHGLNGLELCRSLVAFHGSGCPSWHGHLPIGLATSLIAMP